MNHDTDDHVYRYKYLPMDVGSVCAIADGTMKYTCPLEFNDPFDCRPQVDVDTIMEAPKRRPDLWKAYLKSKGLSPAEGLQYRRKILTQARRSFDLDFFRRGLIESVGVCSLSRDPLNILMWSHYSSSHRGFLLEFCIPVSGPAYHADFAHEYLFPLEVHYREDRPVIAAFGDYTTEELQHHVLTKSKDWGYEQEERVIDHVRGPGIHTYQRNRILRSVICGSEMLNTDYETIRTTVDTVNKTEGTDIGCYHVEQIDAKYALTVPGHPRLDHRR
ncbi:MAG: DUF2971 domain-containing protein [Sedimenticolaceae bacterium]